MSFSAGEAALSVSLRTCSRSSLRHVANPVANRMKSIPASNAIPLDLALICSGARAAKAGASGATSSTKFDAPAPFTLPALEALS